MRRSILSLTILLLISSFASAQEKVRFNPDRTWNTLRAEYGYLTPLDSDLAFGDAFLSLSYTRRISGHWCWRAGVQYQLENTSIQDGLGLPVSAVFRTKTYGFDGSLRSAAENSAAQVAWDGIVGYEPDQMARDVLTHFLFILFRRAEAFVGLTPGYVFGKESVSRRSVVSYPPATASYRDEGIRINHRFFLTADAGFTLSIPLWRFSLDLTPSVHYLLANSFSEYRQDIDPLTERPVGTPSLKPVRWQFSLSGGLSWLF